MDLKKLFTKGISSVKENLTEEGIKKIVKEVAEKINVKLSDDKISTIAKTVASKVKNVDLEKVKAIAEKEIKKLIAKEK